MASTMSMDELVETGEFSIFELNGIVRLKQALAAEKVQKEPYVKRRVQWYWGPTKTGKTRAAVEFMETHHPGDYATLVGELRTFMNGYRGEKGVIFDDFRCGTLRFEQVLQLLDGYRINTNVKYGIQPWLATDIIITAPEPPERLFTNRETGEQWDNIDQVLRRIDEVVPFLDRIPTPDDSETIEEDVQGVVTGRLDP